MASAKFLFEALGMAHRRAEFSCGEAALDEYIHRYARQQQARGFNRTYVAVPVDEAARIAGFCSINTAAAAPRAELLHPGVMKYLREAGIVK